MRASPAGPAAGPSVGSRVNRARPRHCRLPGDTQLRSGGGEDPWGPCPAGKDRNPPGDASFPHRLWDLAAARQCLPAHLEPIKSPFSSAVIRSIFSPAHRFGISLGILPAGLSLSPGAAELPARRRRGFDYSKPSAAGSSHGAPVPGCRGTSWHPANIPREEDSTLRGVSSASSACTTHSWSSGSSWKMCRGALGGHVGLSWAGR